MAQRATSLGTKPSLFVCCFVFFFPFLSLLFNSKKKPCFFPQKRAFFCLFLSVSLCFSLAFFLGLPLFQFLFLCLSLPFFFLSSFLSFFFAFFCFLVFVSLFPFLSSLLLFHEEDNIKNIQLQSFSSLIFSLLGGFLSCFIFEIPFSYLCVFLLSLSYVFCSTSLYLVSKIQVEKHQFLVKRGVSTKRFFFMSLVFCKMRKVIVFFGGHFFG